MSRVIASKVVKQIPRIAAAALAFGLGAGVALAKEPIYPQRVEAEMLRGADYSAAWAAASQALGPVASPGLAARILRSQSEMNQGKDYVAANDAASRDAPTGDSSASVARSRRVEAALNAGKDYVAARDEGDESERSKLGSARTGWAISTTGRSGAGQGR